MRSTTPRLLAAAALAVVAALVTAQVAVADSRTPISNPTVASWPGSPSPSAAFNWKQRAVDYDSFVYNWSQPGSCPTIQTDTAHYNMSTNTYKMPTYYCDTSQLGSTNGQQEAWNQVASVVGASLVGVDKSNQGGLNYVDMSRTFYNPTLGVAVDKPNVTADNVFASSYAYAGLTNALYYMMGAQYPSATDMTTMLRSIAEKYYAQIVALGGANVDFAGGGFNFSTMQSIDRGSGDHEGGEAAIASAAILTWAYAKFGDAKYLNGAKWAMNYVEKSSPSLFYEVTPLLAPYIAARLNATQGTSYSVSKAFSNLLGPSATRDWGTINQNWNGYDTYGLIGSPGDGGGYAFAMNSFMTSMFSSTAKYDPRYANTVGRWLLNVSNAARFFYADQMPANKQFYGSTYIADPAHVIPYEGLRLSENGQSPTATGDPWKYGAGWGLSPTATNLSLYSGSFVGFLGGILTPTNVTGINRIDLNKLDFYSDTTYPEYLYYNPGASAASVQVDVGATAKEVYDAVSDTVLIGSASGTQTISVPAGGSRIIVLAPSNVTPTFSNGNTLIGGKVVRYSTDSPDLAAGTPVTVSSTVNGNVGSNLTDGDGGTRWESATHDPEAFYVDLGSAKTFSSVQLDWQTASAKNFQVLVSNDAQTWTTVYATTGGPGNVQRINFPPVTYRYVGLHLDQRNTQWAYSLWGFHVYNSDLALSQPVTVTSTANGNQASNLTDGNSLTRWESSASDPQDMTVDLGAAQTVNTVRLNWEQASAKNYTIDVSTNGGSWSTVYTATNHSGGVEVLAFSPATARYVRVHMTARNFPQWAYSAFDFGVYNTDLARTATVTVSSTTNGNLGDYLTDGSRASRWESGPGDAQSFTVDLRDAQTVGSVAFDWEAAYGSGFDIQVSTDNSTWNTVKSITGGTGGLENETFTPTTARYVRVLLNTRGTQWAYSLWAFSVYAK